jgi:predicted GH43/DUF377 family glycosyl hydrolase
MLRPSRTDRVVIGVFNPGCIRYGNETILLLRVAEAPVSRDDGEVSAPWFDADTGDMRVQRWRTDTSGVDTSDPRVIVVDGRTWLTSMSHFRVARSRDGIHFDIGESPAMSAATALESFGIEDPRITLLDGTYWINYSAISPRGIATALASTRDFVAFQRHGLIFAPPNRDVTLFPERVDGRYFALHRPMPEGIGEHAIWSASSPDLISWGDHRYVAGARPGAWDDAKVGGGAVPFRVRVGVRDAWLAIYHGVRSAPLQYALGALLLDAADPSRVIARSREPVLAPEAPYERHGFFDGVVFTCGVLVDDDRVRVYYGAADGVTAVADLSLDAIIAGLE